MMKRTDFQWDENKEKINEKKHGVSFSLAQLASLDSNRVILEDVSHSQKGKRFYCIGRVTEGILTVRFTYRDKQIRIIGAGYWRKGKRIHEKQNTIH